MFLLWYIQGRTLDDTRVNTLISSSCPETRNCTNYHSPCLNSGSCIEGAESYTCDCSGAYFGIGCQHFNTCATNPCGNEGKCVIDLTVEQQFTCFCPSGTQGQLCEETVLPCDSNPCLNGAMCTNRDAGFICECTPGFSGSLCEVDIDECESSPCRNGGSCSDAINGFVCSCPVDFSGPTCETEVIFCRQDSCLNGATCNEVAGGFSCSCLAGFTGSDCSEDIDECEIGPCFNDATCTNTAGSFVCLCGPNFTGHLCRNETDYCTDAPCDNGACVSVLGGFECQCDPGFTGALCDHNINDCDPNPCLNSATCVDSINQYTCICPPGYSGLNCQVDINNCASSPCLNGGTCIDGVDMFSCICPPEFSGPLCAAQTDFCIDSPCFSGGTCNNTDGGFSCACPSGWSGNLCQYPDSVVTKLQSCRPGNYTDLLESFGVMTDTGLLSLPTNASLQQTFAFQSSVGFYFSAWIWQEEAAATIFSYNSSQVYAKLLVEPAANGQVTFTSTLISHTDTSFSAGFSDVPLAPFQWHHIAFSAMVGEVSLAVDSNYYSISSEFIPSEMITFAIGDLETSNQFSGIIRGATLAAIHSFNFSLSSLTRCVVHCVGGDEHCDNGGQCLDQYGILRRCECPYGYTGPFCQYTHDRYEFNIEGIAVLSPVQASLESINLDFKTGSQAGPLFIHSGQLSESSLSLMDSTILKNDIGYCDTTSQLLTINSSSTLTDQQWHSLSVGTNLETEIFTAQVDNSPSQTFGLSLPDSTCLNPSPYTLRLGPSARCIRNVAINSLPLDSSALRFIGTANFGCMLDTAHFFGESYIELPTFISRESQSIALDINTLASTGIVYFSHRVPAEPTPDPRDFIAIHLEDARVVFSFNLGEAGREVNIQSAASINDGGWHHVEAMQNGTMAALIVDGVETMDVSSGPFSLLDTNSQVFLGRVPPENRITGFSEYTNFYGCIRDLEQNGWAVNLWDSHASQNVRFGQCN